MNRFSIFKKLIDTNYEIKLIRFVSTEIKFQKIENNNRNLFTKNIVGK